MIIRPLVLPIILTFVLVSCVEKKDGDNSDIINTRNISTQFESNTFKSSTNLSTAGIISTDGIGNFILSNTVQEIESRSGTHLKLNQVTDECYTESSNSEFQLLFLRDTLISISFFDSSYQTTKGFKVDDKIPKLLSIYPEVKYHELTSNMGDESYYITTKYYTTQPNDQGNAFTFYVSDSNPNTISIIEVTNYSGDHSACDAY